MRQRLRWILLLLFILLPTAVGETTPLWAEKVDPWVWQTAVIPATPTETEFLVYLSTQADLGYAATLSDKVAKGRYVYEQLTAVARQTQPAVIAQLNALGADYKPFWIANMIWVRGDATVIEAMAQRADVAHLFANPTVSAQLPETAVTLQQPRAQTAVEWNIHHIDAPQAWSLGATGQGIVIGGQDTGYEWDHPALKTQYRGWNGGSVDHAYNWHDATTSPCPDKAPCDDNSHGTHTMGTMVGDDGGSNQIGVAPGARWIGCRNMVNGFGTPATYIGCYQWFIAPYPPDGDPMQDGDPALAPHVINNSWSCPPYEGCTDPLMMQETVDNVRAAGIVTVHSAGNSGPGCSTIDTPAAIYDSSFTVGNTTGSDTINVSSSRGPVTVDGSNRLKPDISAPGTSIRSAILNGGYGVKTGTSMAGPHVAGLVALLISANPTLAGNVDAIEQIIRDTAVPLTTGAGCGGDTPTAVPNNVYGYGRISALSTVTSALPFENHAYLPFVQSPQTP